MNPKLLLALVALLLVGATVWLFLPGEDHTTVAGSTPSQAPAQEDGSAEEKEGRPERTKPLDRSSKESRRDAVAKEETELAAERAMHKRMVARQQKQFEEELSVLVAKLGLDSAQAEALQKYFDLQLAKMEALLARGDGESMNALAGIMRAEDLDKALEKILTTEQLAMLDGKRSDDRHRNVENQASQDLANLGSRLNLSGDQSQALYEVLYQQTGSRYDNNRALQPLLALLSDGEEIRSARRALPVSATPGGTADPGAILDVNAAEAAYRAAIEQEIAPLKNILTDEQMDHYRNYLLYQAGDALVEESSEEFSSTEDRGSGKVPAPIFIPNR